MVDVEPFRGKRLLAMASGQECADWFEMRGFSSTGGKHWSEATRSWEEDETYEPRIEDVTRDEIGTTPGNDGVHNCKVWLVQQLCPAKCVVPSYVTKTVSPNETACWRKGPPQSLYFAMQIGIE